MDGPAAAHGRRPDREMDAQVDHPDRTVDALFVQRAAITNTSDSWVVQMSATSLFPVRLSISVSSWFRAMLAGGGVEGHAAARRP